MIPIVLLLSFALSLIAGLARRHWRGGSSAGGGLAFICAVGLVHLLAAPVAGLALAWLAEDGPGAFSIGAAVLVLAPAPWAAWSLAGSAATALRRQAGGLSLAVGAVLLVLAACEMVARLAPRALQAPGGTREQVGRSLAPSPIPELRYEMIPDHTWAHQYSSNPRGSFDEANRVVYRTNAAGFRDREFTLERSPGALRLVMLGDSFGFGEGVREEDTVASLLEAHLGEAYGCPVEVYNLSVIGYTTEQEAALLEARALRYQPDAILVWYFLNDVGTVGTLDHLGAGEVPVFFSHLRPFSSLARFLGDRLDRVLRARQLVRQYFGDHDPEGEPWRRTVRALERISSLAAERGIPAFLFVHPVLFRLDDAYPFAALHAQVTRAAQAAGLTSFDLLEAFRGQEAERLWVHPSDQHPNEIATRLAARFAAARLAGIPGPCVVAE
jgi:hypothetical protein